MTKDDFYIIRNSIPMRRVAEYYSLKINHKGFIKCPFHGSGAERTPSLQIYDGFRGFYCRGCGTGGDVTKFVELYEGVSQKDAALLLSERFNVPVSDNGEVPEEVRRKANETVSEVNVELKRQSQISAELRRISAMMHGYRRLVDGMVPFSDDWCTVMDEITRLTAKWEWLFGQMKKVRISCKAERTL